MQVRRAFRGLSVLLICTLFALLVPLLTTISVAAAAATFTVGLTGDDVGSHTAHCGNPTNTDCTLRDAVIASNANDPGPVQNTIQFKAGLSSPILLVPTHGTLPLNKNVSIVGPGADLLALDGANGVTIFTVANVSASIWGLTIQHGNGGSLGGGIVNQSGGTLMVLDAVFSHNHAPFGGGIYNDFSTLFIVRSTFADNAADGNGGGIQSRTGTLNVFNSTFSGNRAVNGNGGGISNGQSATVTTTTITNNSAVASGGGIDNNGPLTLSGTIIAGNTSPTGPDVNVFTPITDGGYNLIGSPGGNTFVDGTNHDKVGTSATPLDPKLSALGTYGGHTPTHALLPGSPAIDTIPAGFNVCTATTDQRGITRPQPAGTACDMGAFESQGFTLAVAGGNNQSTLIIHPFPSALSVRLTSVDPGVSLDGTVITFSPPATGASVVLSSTIATPVGGITSVTATANGIPGTYVLSVSAPGVAPIAFSLTNIGPPTAITTVAGTTPQSTTVGTSFGTPFAVKVTDQLGTPVPGQVVTFTAPASGPSGTFAAGVTTATTNTSGIATAVAFTANGIAGSYTVQAGMTGVTIPAIFTLANSASAPATMVASTGTPQTTPIGTSFSIPFAVTITDQFSNPLTGIVVTFSAPASGPSGNFADGVTTATTNAAGIATAPTFFANNTLGEYQVTATVYGLTATFALTNTAVPLPQSKPGAAPSGGVSPVDSRTGNPPTGGAVPPPIGR